jgi:hypothetical protein
LCAGKDCRTRCEYRKVRTALDDHCTVIDIKCVGLCAGPVVVAHPTSDRPLVLAKLRTKRDRKQLVRLVVGDDSGGGALTGRLVTGGKQKKILRRVERALG